MGYENYVFDRRHMKDYSDYQARYAETIRESDKGLISKIDQISVKLEINDRKVKLIDIGCSTGNLLLHLKRLSDRYELHGADLAPEVIKACASNVLLQGISFHEVDMLDISKLKKQNYFDIVVLNAALMFFSHDQFVKAISECFTILQEHGRVIIFDYFNPYEQELEIIETSAGHPAGLKFYFRSYKKVSTSLEKIGITCTSFEPFFVPIDIGDEDKYDTIQTHSVLTNKGTRMSLRGVLNQPWCYLELTR